MNIVFAHDHADNSSLFVDHTPKGSPAHKGLMAVSHWRELLSSRERLDSASAIKTHWRHCWRLLQIQFIDL